MINKKISYKVMQKILQLIEEGIHVIDKNGISIVYNSAMSEIEGLEQEQVIGKYLLDNFPSLTDDTSTLLRALRTGEIIREYKQSYLNLKGKKISSINTTLPIVDDNENITGAIEIARNITNVSHLSEKIMELQQKLTKSIDVISDTNQHYTFNDIIGQDENLLNAISFARKAAMTSSSVLIYGETGTGKELFAQSIHYGGTRRNKQFIAQNCAALPESLLEGMLFGTSKGGFTGAIDRPGLFEQANGGTLFLDEINSMDTTLQAKLLRVLQEGYVRRLGGLKDIPVDVRIIASTNEDPIEAINKGTIRKDLFYRINVINIHIPPLKKRSDDINILVNYFTEFYNNKFNKDVMKVSGEVKELFLNYSWPGNVRELQNYIESAMNMVGNDRLIKTEHLPFYAQELMIKNRISNNKGNTINDIEYVNDLNDYISKIEEKVIRKNLIENSNNISKAASSLGISRQNLQYKMKKYKITD